MGALSGAAGPATGAVRTHLGNGCLLRFAGSAAYQPTTAAIANIRRTWIDITPGTSIDVTPRTGPAAPQGG